MSLFDLNRATIIGNITKEPQLKYTQNGTAVMQFSVATNRSVQNEDGSYRDIPTFHNIVVWSKVAERLAKFLEKGMKVYIEGRIENRTYEKNGEKKYISEIVASNVINFNKKKKEEKPAETVDDISYEEEQDNDIPF